MVVALLYEMQTPCNCFTLSLSGSDSRRSNSWRDDNDATMEIKVSRRWRWWSRRCFGDGDHKHKMMMAISYHLYWLHVMLILYASYLALIDGSIIRWSLTNYQEVFSLSMHRCESSSCWDTTWWSGVIGSSSLTRVFRVCNCFAPVVFERRAYHTRSSRGVSARRTFATVHTQGEHWDRKVERESYSRYDQDSDVHHWNYSISRDDRTWFIWFGSRDHLED